MSVLDPGKTDFERHDQRLNEPEIEQKGENKEQGHAGHSHWMMIACCIPMLAIAVAIVAAGGGAGFLVGAVICTLMMAAMMSAMSGGGSGG